ncbi:MAG: peroxide stress protein YaaA [Paludibacterium sp.]|uniref:peroxide stress protein YaaA n=1 Tax=Paludibacterium sp. TaxID=1917523 RepID=UPI0025CF270C|nr:peroxide stress protein YaaA [Paludibacterium sp.]MBV8048797.1 peroxide stress protein YaaA [Paludibacterium sp.]MBV8645907.1 peroxide stress protein YaaA [Paludibacterium sp.]
MLMVISPAKTLDYDTPAHVARYTLPDLLDHSAELIKLLRTRTPADIAAMMGISDALATLNVGRYHDWQPHFTPDNAKQAVLAFMGDVYEGLDAATLDAGQLDWLQNHLRILSGLYGCLRPLDLMQAYRLEMGIKLANARGKDLYAYWGDRITERLNDVLAADSDPVLVNLASNEYFKSVRPAKLRARVVTPVFQDQKGGQYKVISFHAKRARGLMVRWAVEHAVTDPQTLKAFDSEGYAFSQEASTGDSWVFRREAVR